MGSVSFTGVQQGSLGTTGSSSNNANAFINVTNAGSASGPVVIGLGAENMGTGSGDTVTSGAPANSLWSIATTSSGANKRIASGASFTNAVGANTTNRFTISAARSWSAVNLAIKPAPAQRETFRPSPSTMRLPPVCRESRRTTAASA